MKSVRTEQIQVPHLFITTLIGNWKRETSQVNKDHLHLVSMVKGMWNQEKFCIKVERQLAFLHDRMNKLVTIAGLVSWCRSGIYRCGKYRCDIQIVVYTDVTYTDTTKSVYYFSIAVTKKQFNRGWVCFGSLFRKGKGRQKKSQWQKHEVINLSAESVRTRGQTKNRTGLQNLKPHPHPSFLHLWRFHNLLQQCCQLGTKCSNTCISGGHCKLKPQNTVRTNRLSNQVATQWLSHQRNMTNHHQGNDKSEDQWVESTLLKLHFFLFFFNSLIFFYSLDFISLSVYPPHSIPFPHPSLQEDIPMPPYTTRLSLSMGLKSLKV
jgi:hypothetical protein